eukprot:CCRYP_015817-RA/>CCRYP_015817-RA protein AED:0.44 eAED:0.44 QI:283/0.5/0.66/1/0.5/0.33/3/0/90
MKAVFPRSCHYKTPVIECAVSECDTTMHPLCKYFETKSHYLQDISLNSFMDCDSPAHLDVNIHAKAKGGSITMRKSEVVNLPRFTVRKSC